jgi:hypothetical protein
MELVASVLGKITRFFFLIYPPVASGVLRES